MYHSHKNNSALFNNSVSLNPMFNLVLLLHDFLTCGSNTNHNLYHFQNKNDSYTLDSPHFNKRRRIRNDHIEPCEWFHF